MGFVSSGRREAGSGKREGGEERATDNAKRETHNVDSPSNNNVTSAGLRLLLCIGLAVLPTLSVAQSLPPAVVTLRGEALAAARARIESRDARLLPAYRKLLSDADKALRAPLIAVADKRTHLAPSGDKHDYFSLSPYWWPDPSKPNGLPYIRRDGVTNPESKRDLDQPRVAAMGANVQTLALAYHFTNDRRYAERAAQQLRAWFLDSATRMNPHLRYAQLVRGLNVERSSGIIDTRWFIEAVDAIGLLRGSNALTASDERGLRDWFARYLDWLLSSANVKEREARNNHGSWFAAQTATYALFIGDTAKAREIASAAKPRIGWQIRPDGQQPIELERTRSFHYSGFNVEALSRVAEIGRKVGVDLWSYTAPEGGSLIRAVDNLARYLGTGDKWPGQQIDSVEPELMLIDFRRADFALDTLRYGPVLSRLPQQMVETDRSALLFPDPPASRARRPGDSSNERAPPAPAPTTGGVRSATSGIFISPEEGAELRAALGKYPLLDKSIAEDRATMDSAFAHPIDVPQPGEAGGYAHERHKQNYLEMETAGILFRVTGDARYATFVRDMLEKYAILYPTLGPHPLAKDQAPGKLFHQSLNEANWLLATAVAYDCIHDWLKPAERARFEKNIFRPMADWISVSQAKEFDRIHNHGTWATAAVGSIGYAMGDTSYVNRALYGTKRDRTGGFLRQLDLLFSPDGYYMEGPYYVRYALLPFFQFAEAVNRRQPALGIYEYRGQILKKALYSALETSFPNGIFPPINDASRTMAITSREVVLALDLAYKRYGANANLLGDAAIQSEVILNPAGLAVAKDMSAARSTPRTNWGSVEFTDGSTGEDGGLGILRSGTGPDATMLLMKYGVHGGGHGHFDQLHFILFDGGREVVPDYGFSRWINVEPKFGGRYLPENDTYAKQTIAHNTVVVDETSQSRAKQKMADSLSGRRSFFSSADPSIQVMSARADSQYPGVGMQRTMFLIRDRRLAYPVVVDLYRLSSSREHRYDYPIHFRGQLIATNVKYSADSARQVPLGGAFGFQHIWREAEGPAPQSVQMTWLDGNRYYSAITAAGDGARVVFGRTGANDPSFNLIDEPMMIIRQRATNQLFASAIEPHGYFSEPAERSDQARPHLRQVQVLHDDAETSIVAVTGDDNIRWTIMVSNLPASATTVHRVTVGGRTYEWSGNFAVEGVMREARSGKREAGREAGSWKLQAGSRRLTLVAPKVN